MRLLRLEISGFKSFCDKVSLNFVQDGISIVVGPNGCGKSNIVDAIRWALGEQSAKHLRGASMEDVIFNGSSARQAVSMAQVTLVFSNPNQETLTKYAEFSEISITRRLYRSGESQYLINKTNCRLTDIKEMFMDTGIGGKGYSIIEQGKVDQIVTSRAEERRTIIDEAAGIVRFKVKRKEAERKFAATKQNLLRVEDIVAELKRQEETLVTQVEQAEKYLEKKARLERLRQCTSATRWYKLKTETDRVTSNRAKNQREMDDLGTANSVLEADLSTLQLNLTQKDSQKAVIQERLQAKKEEIIKLESKLDSDNAAIENLDEWQKRGAEESDLLSKQIKTVEFQIETHHKETARLEEEILSRQKTLEQAEGKEKHQNATVSEIEDRLKDIQQKEVAIITRITKDQNFLAQATERLADLEKEWNKLESQELTLQTELASCQTSLSAATETLKGKKQQKELVLGKTETLQFEKENAESQLKLANSELSALTKESHKTESRILSLNELIQSHEGYDSATKKFLDHLDNDPDKSRNLGFIGTLAELVNPPDMEKPQTTAFLNRYFNLLVFKSYKQIANISKAVNQLKIEQLQIYFMDLLENQTPETRLDWISSREGLSMSVPLAGEFQSVTSSFQDLSVEEILQAGGLIGPDAVIMTRARIFLVGMPNKSNQAERFFSRQSEVESLERGLDELTDKIEQKEGDLDDTEIALNELSNNLDRYRKEKIELDLEILSLEKEVDSKSFESERLNRQLRQTRQEIEETKATRIEIETKQKTLSTDVTEGEDEISAVKSAIQAYQNQLRQTVDNRDDISEEVQRTRITLAGLVEKRKSNDDVLTRLKNDIVERTGQLENIQSRVDETKGKRDWYTAAIKKTKNRLPELLDELSVVERELTQVKNEIESDTARAAELQKTIAEERARMTGLNEKNHRLEVKLAQLIQEATNIADNMFSEYSVHPEELIATFDVENFNINKEAATIAELKQSVGSMDDVNLAAKKEYDSLKERLDFLTGQSADLSRSLEALENSIQKINQESRRRFKESFKLINDHFSLLFPRLFGGGEAYLELTDESDLLETGVEIIAKPPGKKLQNMTLMSGGEKALTAIALIFAIFQIKPSPFCLLDEVDAPLDEANNVRFNRHVKELTENSQFIVITHNKKTMEIGNALFGVTMEEPGVSKIVSVDFNKIAIGA